MLGHFVSYSLMLGHAGVRAPRRDTRYRVCSFGTNLLHLGNVGKRVSRRFLGLQLFHVKPYEANEAGTNMFVPISEPIKVGLEKSQHSWRV